MKHSFEEKLSYLFDEIGGVDDRMLTEAIEYRAARHRGRMLHTLTAIACALLVIVTGASVLLFRFGNVFSEPKNDGESPGDAATVWDTHTLDALLQSAKGEANCSRLSSQTEIAYFGEAHLLWQYAEDDGVYQSRALRTRELEHLCDLIADGKAVGNAAPAQIARVWLVLGNGEVLTPYLPATPGNTSSAIFDYEAELTPSDELISLISDILKP